MKTGKILALTIIGAILAACNLDFSNESDDEWIVTNNSKNAVTITFDEDSTETIAAGATQTFFHSYDTGIDIADSFHVDYEKSYSYSSSTAKRTLVITDQTVYSYVISNTLTSEVSFELNIKKYPVEIPAASTITQTDTEEENVKKFTIAAATTDADSKITPTTGSLTVYKSAPKFKFYQGTTYIDTYTQEKKADGNYYITIQ